MDFTPVKHAFNRALGTRDAIYFDTNAWSLLAKGKADLDDLQAWLDQSNSVLVITRFSIGELAKDPILAEALANLIASLNVIFIDLGTNDLSGKPWQQVPYAMLQSLTPTDAAAKKALVEVMRSKQIQETMEYIRPDAVIWQRRFEQMIARQPEWAWADFDAQLMKFIRDTCKTCGYEVNVHGLSDTSVYVGIKLSFGVAFQRYFLNRQPFKPSDYVDYLHCSDMAYCKTVVTEKGTCHSIKEVQKRILGLGPETVHNLSWFTDIAGSAKQLSESRKRS